MRYMVVSFYLLTTCRNATLCNANHPTPQLEPTCGRPMGIRFQSLPGILIHGQNKKPQGADMEVADGEILLPGQERLEQLLVADAYFGLHVVDAGQGGQMEKVLGEAAGQNLGFLNDAEYNEEDGDIYFTQTSTKWNLK